MLVLFIIVVSYLLGSIPFGLVLTKLSGHGDIRAIGSGNIGATNVLRTGSKILALATLLLDGGKGAAAVGLSLALSPPQPIDAVLAAAAALLGHLFPFWLGGKGGKGVATNFGIWLALAWPLGLAGLAAWLVSALVFRYSSLSALIAVALLPLLALFFADRSLIGYGALSAALIFWRHRANIVRLRHGNEPKIGKTTNTAGIA